MRNIENRPVNQLGPDGDLRYKTSFFDFKTDSEVSTPWQDAEVDAVLLFEGVFLHRPELMTHWDFSIFVHADFEVTINHAQKRDLYLFETPAKIRGIYEQRYIPGQKIYLNTERPFEKTTVFLDNNDFNNPSLKIT